MLFLLFPRQFCVAINAYGNKKPIVYCVHGSYTPSAAKVD